ncbi:hypothetical protein EGW08_010812, partial [Elysia chlorotica]
MSLNKYMHPKNRYKNAKPSFLQLALKYPDFRALTTQDESGKVFLDFKNADALRALTRCLLKEDFDLTVELPTDRLVPTLPLRLNYIHWIEDIVGTDGKKWGMDIGTGASCIYPLLASKMNQWSFLATETDAENIFHAKKNVENNNLSHLIYVKNGADESILTSSLQAFTETKVFDFCMCNPPFFADHMEAQGLVTTRSDDRPDAGSVSTASPQECIVAGGEVGFVRQMIEESTVLREKVRVYTSMLGKKSSLAQLKEELRHQKVAKFSTTEFCQGKTMRWGIAWTFDPTVTFPRSQFEARKTKPPILYVIPKGSGSVEYKVHDLARHLRNILESIKVHCYQGKQAKAYTSITLTATENTWCHQRRLRRQKQLKNSGPALESQLQAGKCSEGEDDKISNDTQQISTTEGGEPSKKNDKNGVTAKSSEEEEMSSAESSDSPVKNSSLKRSLNDPLDVKGIDSKRFCTEISKESNESKDSSEKPAPENEKEKELGSQNGINKSGEKPPKEYILKCVMRLKRSGENINLELEWLDGTSRELMHQVFTFLKNKLA